MDEELEQEIAANEDEEQAVDEQQGNDDEETVLTIGEEEPEQQDRAPDWVRELRRERREDKKRIKELEARLEAPKTKEVGSRPTLEDCEFDQDRFDRVLDKWMADKAAADAEQAKAERERADEERRWQESVNNYNEKKAALTFEDVDAAEDAVRASLSDTQWGIIVHAAQDPAKVVYGLSKFPNHLQGLASEQDAVKFTAQMARLEATMTTKTRRRKPAPETPSPSGGGQVLSGEKRLEKAIEKAQKTGDMSEVRRIRKEMRQAS